MKFKKYFDYFNFIRHHWNWWLALFTIYHEIRGEKKYRINTTSVNNLVDLEIFQGDKKNAYIYQPVNYFMLETALGFLKDEKIEGSLVDFGCGKGRVIAVAAHYGFKNITGVEFAPALCNEARNNLKNIKDLFPECDYSIICDNALNYKIRGTDNVFVFFNPFDETIMLPIVRNILQSLKDVAGEITVVYFNPTEKEIFQSAGFQEIWYFKKMEYLDFSILRLQA